MGKWGGRIGYVGNLLGCPYIHCNPPFVHSSRISTAFKSTASSQRCRAGGRATPGRSKHHHHRHRCSRPPGPPTRGGKQPANWDEQAPPATTRSTTTTPPWASVRRAGHAATRKPGTLRVKRATRPLRYSPYPEAAACPVLPVPAARIADRADSMRSCKRSAAASPFFPPSAAKSISRAVAHSSKTIR